MKISSWNIRGGNDPLKQQEVLDFIRNTQVDIIGILETRIKEKAAKTLIKQHYRNYNVVCNYAAHYNGRIWLIWRPTHVTVIILKIHSQFIHCEATHHATGHVFHLNMVYASNKARTCDDLWVNLQQISTQVQHWLILGDFNVVGMLVKGTGCEMTWTNKQDISSIVWSKLDRALANSSWLNTFPGTCASFLPASISDHSPVLVTVFEDKHVGSRFSFLNSWVEHPDYHNLVSKAWQEPVAGSTMFKLFKKLKNVKGKLKKLHKENFTHMAQQIKDIKEALHHCQEQIQANLPNSELYDQERTLLATYTSLKQLESSIIKQKAKIDHISYSDSSSKYFARIQDRKHQQIIGRIFDKDGNERIGVDNVAAGFIDYYKHLLGSPQST
ncbi:uncharacterized protein LOC141640051 [Silene latifolia]|uniref:uncharacterized protein LOC141640051 n=1 Tax=Silene latifolia TaxID=37657 RepID=UPI003D77B51B